MKRILITGGVGFIGGWLVSDLLSDPDNKLYVVDDLSSNPTPYVDWYLDLPSGHNMSFFEMTVQDFARFAYHNGQVDFDEIYHLASPVGPAGVLAWRGSMVRQIVDDTYAVLGLATRMNAKLVYVSTSEVYGGGQSGACSERMDRIVPARMTTRLEYAVAKLAGEAAVLNSPVRARIVRPFNVAGPRQSSKGGFVVPRFIEQATKNEPITVFGTGTQIRAFTHVRDIAQGLIKVAQNGSDGEVYNLGYMQNMTTVEYLAETVKQLTRSTSDIIHVNGKDVYGPLYEEAADKWPVEVRHGDLHWWPHYGISDIIHDAVEYMETHRSVLS